MPHKSLQYYKNTIILKLAAQGCRLLDSFGGWDAIKKRTSEEVDAWLKMQSQPGGYSSKYTAYSFLTQPNELENLLIFDKEGIPLGWKHAHPSAHNPLMISYLTLLYSNHYFETGSDASKNYLVKLLDFLLHFGKKTETGFWLPYHQAVPKYGLEAPWFSGLAQAVAMSAFLRGYEITSEKEYHDCAQKLGETLLLPTELGGFLEKLEGGGVWIQEYPTSEIKQVLNGLLFCLIGLYEYLSILGSLPKLKETITSCEKTLFERLPNYLYGPFTRYAWSKASFSNIEYQGLFVFLFLHLYELSGKPIYHKLAIRFHNYTDWPAFFEFYELAYDRKRLPQTLSAS